MSLSLFPGPAQLCGPRLPNVISALFQGGHDVLCCCFFAPTFISVSGLTALGDVCPWNPRSLRALIFPFSPTCIGRSSGNLRRSATRPGSCLRARSRRARLWGPPPPTMATSILPGVLHTSGWGAQGHWLLKYGCCVGLLRFQCLTLGVALGQPAQTGSTLVEFVVAPHILGRCSKRFGKQSMCGATLGNLWGF